MVAAAMPEDFGAQYMAFSRSYEHFPAVIVARTHGPTLLGPEDLAGHNVAVRDEAGLLSHLRALARVHQTGQRRRSIKQITNWMPLHHGASGVAVRALLCRFGASAGFQQR